MTSTEEQAFIRLWNTGMETAEIGRQLGIPRGTVSAWVSTDTPRRPARVSNRVSDDTPGVQYLPPLRARSPLSSRKFYKNSAT
jgi:hypothetical protein